MKSSLFCAIFTSDRQQTLNIQAKIMTFRVRHIQNNKLCCDRIIISIKVGKIGNAEDLSAPLRSMHGKKRKHTKFCRESQEERGHKEHLDVGEIIILKLILEK
jgi:hypothetical protein